MSLNDEKKPICDCCFIKRDDFKPDIGGLFICLKEIEIFECLTSLNGSRAKCFWKDKRFKKIDKDGG